MISEVPSDNLPLDNYSDSQPKKTKIETVLNARKLERMNKDPPRSYVLPGAKHFKNLALESPRRKTEVEPKRKVEP